MTEVDPLGPARVGWEETRAALAAAGAAAAGLLRSIEDPSRPGVGRWSVEELAVHLTHPWLALPALCARDLDGVRAALPAVPGVAVGLPSGALLKKPEDLGPLTIALVEHDSERDLNRLADRIEAGVKGFCEQFDPTADPGLRPWMIEGIAGGPELFAAHLLNETLVHGYDLARGTGLPFAVPDEAAALVFRGFLLHILVNRTALLAAAGAATGPPFALDLRLAGDRRLLLRNGPTGLRVLPAGSAPVDSHLWIRPAAMLLMVWKRRSLSSIVRSGQMLVWGRRPQAAKRLMSLAPKV